MTGESQLIQQENFRLRLLSFATDVIVDVAGGEDACLQDAVVVAVVDDEQTAGPDERPEVAERPPLLRQSAVEVGQCRQRVAEAEHGVKARPCLHVLHVLQVVDERQPVRLLDDCIHTTITASRVDSTPLFPRAANQKVRCCDGPVHNLLI